jgi:hypothetical protein
MVTCGMFSKWRIEGIDDHVFGEDGKLYKLPYHKDGRYYGIREIKMQHPNRYRINNEWWSKRQLKHKIYLDEKPVKLYETEILPF